MNDKVAFQFVGESPRRLDLVLLEYIESDCDLINLSRSQLQILIKNGLVEIDGIVTTKPGGLIKPGTGVSFVPAIQPSTDLKPYSIELDIVYEDEDLLVINKPVGLSMHPGAGNPDKTLANALVAHWNIFSAEFSKSLRPGIVHRLDKDTTGLVVVAKNIFCHTHLANQFSARTIERRYQALVLSTPRKERVIDKEEEGRFASNIDRHTRQRRKMTTVEEGGKSAITTWKVLERFNYGNLIELKLETGRTHQIRVHMEHLLSPVIGDPQYGDFSALPQQLIRESRTFGRQALHAYKLEFMHPTKEEVVCFNVHPPEDFVGLVDFFRNF